MADKGSFFEIGPLWGTDQVTGFVRLATAIRWASSPRTAGTSTAAR